MSETRCIHVFSKGKNKGQQCKVKKVVLNGKCKAHSKCATNLVKKKLVQGKIAKPMKQAPAVLEHEDTIVQEEVKRCPIFSFGQVPENATVNVPVRIPPPDDVTMIYLNGPPEEQFQGDELDEKYQPSILDGEIQEDQEQGIPQEPNEPNDPDNFTERKSSNSRDDETIDEIMISNYYREMPILESILPISSRGSISAKKWIEKLGLLSNCISGKTAVMGIFSMLCTSVERYGINNGMAVQGYRDNMMNDPYCKQLLIILSMKHGDFLSNMPPEVLLATAMTTTFIGLHAIQRQREN